MIEFKPGIYPFLNSEDYHSAPGISSSGINLIRDCPARYHYKYLVERPAMTQEQVWAEADHFKLGRAFHSLLLEPDNFKDEFTVFERPMILNKKTGELKEASGQTNAYKEALIEFKQHSGSRQILEVKEFNDIKAMVDVARAHPIWKKIKNPKIEHSLFWEAGIYKTQLRARPDLYDNFFIIDIKTTRSIPDWRRTAASSGYFRQAAMQRDALEELTGKRRYFGFFVIEKTPPFLTALFCPTEDDLDLARIEYLTAAADYSECLRYNDWPGYSDNFQKLTMPRYAKEQD